jgi:hypothetical protein
MAYLPHLKTMLTKDTHIIAIKNYIDMSTIFFNKRQKAGKVGKKLDFSYFIIFCFEFFKVYAWLSCHTVCNIGLRAKIMFLQKGQYDCQKDQNFVLNQI